MSWTDVAAGMTWPSAIVAVAILGFAAFTLWLLLK